MPSNILRVDASMRKTGSASRELADYLISALTKSNTDATITHRDLADGVGFVHEAWIGANFTDASERSPDQKEALSQSEKFVGELRAADTIVLATPIYNFGIPAALKAWVDMVTRARETFRYTEKGPVGLLEDKKTYVIVASGGTQVWSEIDFATPYLKHVLGFIGLHDVTWIAADRLVADRDGQMAKAKQQIDGLGA